MQPQPRLNQRINLCNLGIYNLIENTTPYMPQVLYNYSFDKSPLIIVDFKMHQTQIPPTLVNVKHDS